MSRRRLSWLALVVWLAGVVPALAELPQVQADLDTTQVTLGEPLHLRLRLRYRQDERPVLPSLAQSLPEFAVRPEKPQGPSPVGGGVELVVPYELRLYRLGAHPIPPLQIGFVQASGDTLRRATAAAQVQVVAVRQEGEKELRDIKPPFALPGGFPLWLAGILLALVAAGVAAGVYWWRQRRHPPVVQVSRPPVDYLAEFGRIAAMGLLERGAVKIYYSLLSETLRRFLEEHVGVAAMEKTTAEIEAALCQAGLERDLIRDLDRFLEIADLVKFARSQPSLEVARQAPESGRSLVRAVQTFQAARLAPLLEPAADQTSG